MSPVIQNILVTVLGIVYVFSVVGIMDFFVKKGFPQDISRKIVHIAAGSWLIFWVLYDPSHWTKYLNILPAFIWTILLLIKGFTADPDDEAVKTMTRTGDRKELLKGPLYFTIVMNIMGTIFFYNPMAMSAMGMLGWGDGVAPVFGKKFGKHKYKILSEKSIEGSISFFIFGIIGAVAFHLILLGDFDLIKIILCAAIATIIEALSPKDLDNLVIPIACMAFYYFY
ncbi:diacylglycerol/polyprenol kinase family protein [Bacteroidota bacterium]